MPFVDSQSPESYRLTTDDLRAAAARGVSIATTLDWMNEPTDERQIQVARDNIASMRRAGNTIVIGTDQFRKTARAEAELIISRQLMSNLELLRAWSIAAPQAIFPQRQIGRLAEGFEASFLVLKWRSARRRGEHAEDRHVGQARPVVHPGQCEAACARRIAE